ncbi:MAG TPA: hypothetical protein VF062_06500 [Candidatus Limnocylindrales bacterium]
MARHHATVELRWDDQWNDVTGAALDAAPIFVGRGQSAEGDQAQPGIASFSLETRDGTYAWRNPTSPTYGKLRRGTLCRIYDGTPPTPGDDNSSLSNTTSHVAPSLVSPTNQGLLVCAWANPNPAGTYTLPVGMTAATALLSNARSAFRAAYQAIAATGATGTRTATASASQSFVAASVIVNGDNLVVEHTASASAANPLTTDSDTQPGWWAIVHTHYAWDSNRGDDQIPDFPFDDTGGWIQLADTGTLVVNDADATNIRMKAWAKQIRVSGACEIRVFGRDLDLGGSGLFGSPLSSLVVVSGVDPYYPKTHTRVTKLPAIRDVSGNKRVVPVVTAGALKEIDRARAPIRSAIYRTTMAAEFDSVRVAYWPCEDGSGSTQLASAVPGVEPMTAFLDQLNLSSYTGFFGSAALPTTKVGSVAARGRVPHYTGGTYYRGLFAVPAAGITDTAQLLSLYCTGGTIDRVKIQYATTGDLQLRVFDSDGNLLDESSVIDFNVDGTQFLLSIEMVQNGSNVDRLMFVRKVGLDGSVEPGAGSSGTFAGLTIGRVWHIDVAGGSSAGLSFGHQMIGNSQRLVFNIDRALAGWAFERASDRIRRLCRENNVQCEIIGDREQDVRMGPEGSNSFGGHLRECAASGGGILFEPKQFYGIAYRTLGSLYNQEPAATYTYGDRGEIPPPVEPLPDDLLTNNVVTASRSGGSSATAAKLTGELSVEELGEQEASFPVNAPDHALPDHAMWRLHLGTTPGDRFPNLSLDIDALALAGKTALIQATDLLDVGSRVVVDGMADAEDFAPEDLTQLALGFSEEIRMQRRTIALNTVPEAPYHVAEVAHAEYGIIQSDSAVTAEALDTTETGINITCGAGPDWDHEANFDVIIGGERMTVTAVAAMAGTFPNRTTTLTVIRSVNGIVKSHATGARVETFHKSSIGL